MRNGRLTSAPISAALTIRDRPGSVRRWPRATCLPQGTGLSRSASWAWQLPDTHGRARRHGRGQATRTGNDLPVLDARYAPGDVAADGTAGLGDLANAGANNGHGRVRTALELTTVVVAGRQARPTVMDHPGHT